MIPFAAYTAAETPNAFQWAGQPSEVTPSHAGMFTPVLYIVSWANRVSPPKWHLDGFCRFCRAHAFDKHTDRPRYVRHL